MPDYGDERGFGRGSATGRSLADVFRDRATPGIERGNETSRWPTGKMPPRNFMPSDFWGPRRNQGTTAPEEFNAPDRFGRMRPTQANNPYAGRIDNNPMGGANIGGGWNLYEGAPDRTPRWIPMSGDMDSGSYLSSRYGGGIDDAAGMNDSARGMIEDAGFEVAGMTTDDRTERKLWGLAVNSFPPGTPDMQIQQKWEELKQDYYDRKYGGTGLTLPGRDDIVGLGMDLGLDFLESEQGKELFEPFDPNREPIVI